MKNAMKSNNETALGAALKTAVQSLSKKSQTEMIAAHVYAKYEVFKRFLPLALGIHEALIAALPQFDAQLVARVLANHCRRQRYIKSLARGGKRFDLAMKPVGVVSPEEKAAAERMAQPRPAKADAAAPVADLPVAAEGVAPDAVAATPAIEPAAE
jgi:sRNA-binding protein